MKQITKNQFYELAVDPAKNRLYYTGMGGFEKASDVAVFLMDCDRAIGELTRGFTMLSDLAQMKAEAQSPEVKASLEAQTEKFVQAGMGKGAHILPRDAVLKMQVDQVTQKAGVLKMVFASKAEAEAWLDKK